MSALLSYIPHLNTCVSRSQLGLLSPTHDSLPTCYLIKTHCPFPSFEETSLSAWMPAVTLLRGTYFYPLGTSPYDRVRLQLL